MWVEHDLTKKPHGRHWVQTVVKRWDGLVQLETNICGLFVKNWPRPDLLEKYHSAYIRLPHLFAPEGARFPNCFALIKSMTRTHRTQAWYQKHPTANVHWIINVNPPLFVHMYILYIYIYIYIYIYTYIYTYIHIYIYIHIQTCIWARLVISCPWCSMWLGTTTTINYLLIHAVHEANVHALCSVSKKTLKSAKRAKEICQRLQKQLPWCD